MSDICKVGVLVNEVCRIDSDTFAVSWVAGSFMGKPLMKFWTDKRTGETRISGDDHESMCEEIRRVA